MYAQFIDKKFHDVGILIAMGITQGASGFCFFATSLYFYLCGTDIADIEVPDSEVPNVEVKLLLD